MSELIPTPLPTDKATIMSCMGFTSETAVSASSLSLDTNILSTTLYMAFMVIDKIAGHAMFMSSLPMGMVPILFSSSICSCRSNSAAVCLVSFAILSSFSQVSAYYYTICCLQIQHLWYDSLCCFLRKELKWLQDTMRYKKEGSSA